jgi:hypothetical protein
LSEPKKNSSTRQATKGFLGGLEFGFLFYLSVLFLRIAINLVAANSGVIVDIVPVGTELGGFAIGFTGGIVKALD